MQALGTLFRHSQRGLTLLARFVSTDGQLSLLDQPKLLSEAVSDSAQGRIEAFFGALELGNILFRNLGTKFVPLGQKLFSAIEQGIEVFEVMIKGGLFG
jgi:hypothetical protein